MFDPQQAQAPEARRALTWRRYLRFWGPHAASDVDDELRFHLEMRERDYLVRGMSPIDARSAAVRRLGNLDTARTACIGIITRRERRMARAELLDVLWQDARFALRTLGRHKAWTAIAVLTLALGIGANTAMFSVVEGVLWHSLPYPNADRLVFVLRMPKQDLGNDRVFTTPTASVARAWRDGARAILDITAYSTRDVLLRAATRRAQWTARRAATRARRSRTPDSSCRSFSDSSVAIRSSDAVSRPMKGTSTHTWR